MRERLFQHKKGQAGSLKWAIGALVALGLVLALQGYLSRLEDAGKRAPAAGEPFVPSGAEALKFANSVPEEARLFGAELFAEWFPPWRERPPEEVRKGIFAAFESAIGGRPLSATEVLSLQSAFNELSEPGEQRRRSREEARRAIMEVLEKMQVSGRDLQAIWQQLSTPIESWAMPGEP